jgi:class 3 adenylate cyclase/tetratricopeptide (TPR) repeat protein
VREVERTFEMKCANCQTANPEAAKFCFNCGVALAQMAARCSNCGNDLPAGARFCMGCGQPAAITTPTDDARLTRLASAAPAPLAAKIRAAHLTGERKIVTCLFADVVGSTSLAERMDPDDWTAIMNRAFDVMSPAVYRYEGTIARLMGDAILAFFGAPVSHEDDPVRAVHAALEMLAVAQTYADEVRNTHGIEFAIRAGLNTGTVVVGNVGSDLKYEYTAMGDAVNLAARMQSAARTMTTLISEHTHRFVAPVFECADLGPLEVRGKAEPVRVYEVRGAKAVPGRVRGLEAAGLESPMVGRAAELAILRETSEGLKAGKGRIVVIIGEAGLGKSRLIAEWKTTPNPPPPSSEKPPPGEGIRWAEGRSLSYGQGLAYHLLVDLLRSLIGVEARASDTKTHSALARLCADVLGDAGVEATLYLAHMLSLSLDGEAQTKVQTLDPQAIQSHYLAALTAIIHELSTRQPLGLIFDDVHWADPSSVDLLLKLMPLAGEHAVLFCFVTRPDTDTPGWKLIAAAREAGLTEVALSPLSEADSRQLVSNLLEVEALPETIRALILEKAEGNPFFVEEVIRMLIDRGTIVSHGSGWAAGKDIGTVEIPDNVQGLLFARIDRLAEEAKRALRVASVIGRQFAARVLEQVVSAAQHLTTLEGLGLIRLAVVQPDLEYLFRHALVQEAAYNSLVKQDRRQLHLAVGEALEQLYPDRLTSREFAPLLAQHFYSGGDDARALKHLVHAGDAAARVYANPEAILHYTRALEIAKRSGEGGAASLVHIYASLGNALELNAQYAEAMALYSEMETAARARVDRRMEFNAVMARAKVLATPNPAFNPLEGRRALERALELSREIGDRADECRILWNLMVLDIFGGGDMRRAIDCGEQSISLARELGLREREAFATQDIYYAYVAVDRNDMAWVRLREAQALWRELNNVPMLADNTANIAIRHYERGELNATIANANEAYRLYQSIGNVYGIASSRFCISGAYIERGEFGEALTLIDDGIRHAEKSGHVAALIVLLVDQSRVYEAVNWPERGLESARRAASVAQSSFPLWAPMAQAMIARLLIRQNRLSEAAAALEAGRVALKPEALVLYGREMIGLVKGELALARGETSEALTIAESMLQLIARTHCFVFAPEAALLKARAFAGQGDHDSALDALAEALAVARQSEMRWVLWQMLATASECAARVGDAVAAQAFRVEAAEAIRCIADHLAPPDLRESFLNRPAVQAVLG